MFISEKEQQILNYLSTKNGAATIKELKNKIFLSEPSIRRYLNSLADKQLVLRTHGGAIMNYNNPTAFNDIPIFIRISNMAEEKKKSPCRHLNCFSTVLNYFSTRRVLLSIFFRT